MADAAAPEPTAPGVRPESGHPCGHCPSTRTYKHCPTLSWGACPWVTCPACSQVTDIRKLSST